MSFRLDFAPHLGFPTPDLPLFGALTGDTGVESQIAFAAENGFRSVQDPFAVLRTEAEQRRVGAIAADLGITLTCFVYAPMKRASEPHWCADGAAGRAALAHDVDAAIALGRRIGSRHIAVLTGRDPARGKAEQRAAMAANLRLMADRAADAGMVLCVEAVNAQRLPQMLLHHVADAMEVVRAADHPAVRLIFDFAHTQAMDGDIIATMEAAWDLIELFQLADHPGRVEPGAGELNFVRLINEIERRGFRGPCELEHQWSAPGPDVQRTYLEWLGRWRSDA